MRKECCFVYTGRNSKIRAWRLIAGFLLIVILLSAFTASAHADYGPKPSVIITTEDLPESICYGTLLADMESYARYHAVDGSARSNGGGTYAKAYDAFREYAAQDDYYFWGQVFEIKDGYFFWSYYPLEQFKVLLYDANTDTVYAGGETARYALDSIYKASIHADGTVSLSKAPYVMHNILNFCARVVITVLVEVLIALLLGYREKKEIRFIIAANIVTQFGMNLFLSYSDYLLDILAWLVLFPLIELIIIIVEAIAYALRLKSHSKKRAVFYAVSANIITLLLGALIIWMV